MFKLFSAFQKGRVWDFNGGIHPPEVKTQSNGTPLRQMSLPQHLIIPLKQHIGAEGGLCVRVGNRVLRGQLLTHEWGRILPVHTPTSGTITTIAPHAAVYPSGLAEMGMIIGADGEDYWIERDGWSDYQVRTREALIEHIHQFNVAGLGGTGFPTGNRLHGGGDKIRTLIINIVECEPYITADDRLMQDCVAQIVDGIRILVHILQPNGVLIGTEENKPQAISMLRAVPCGTHGISLCVIPTKYPSDGAKRLTQILTDKQIPHGGHSSDIGVLMQNMGTAYVIKRAVIDDGPLTKHVVTLTGEAVSRPDNVRVRLGTPVHHLLNDTDFCASTEPIVVMGGPLMDFTLPGLDVPVVKIINCLLAPPASGMGEPQEEKGCIRCNARADAYPVGPLSQQLYQFSEGQQHDKATAHNLAGCIECGACAWVCPGNIPLMQYFRQGKAEISAIRQEEQRAAGAKARSEARQTHLGREKAVRAERHKKAAVQPAAKDQDAINTALARVRGKQRDAAQPIVVQSGAKPDNSEVIAIREAREAKARARRTQQQTALVEAPVAESVDPHKAAMEVAIARAKARKAEQQVTPVETPVTKPVDPRKAAMGAAIARAKACKAEQQVALMEAPVAGPVDPRKAVVEAAITRAKTRKAEQQVTPVETPAAEPIDPRRAVMEVVIARAKARKTEQQAAPVEAPTAEPADPRKAAVEATIARAKARKTERQAAQPDLASAAANDDPHKAIVAAAIVHVQAHKATQQAVSEE